ncbi:histidine kinase [Maribellus luteus]|nr:histidine kinase [Maribellus luteus]
MINKIFTYEIIEKNEVINVKFKDETITEIIRNAQIEGILEKHDALFETILNTDYLKEILELISTSGKTGNRNGFFKNSNHFQKGRFTTSLRIGIDGMQKEEQVDSSVISGKFTNANKNKEYCFFIGNYVDRSDFDYNITTDSTGYFYLNAKLKKPVEVIIYPPYNNSHLISDITDQTLSWNENILIEPGDSIFLKIDRNGVKASGKGAFKTNLLNTLLTFAVPDSSLPADEVLRIAKVNIKRNLQTIEQSKDSLSNWAYNHLRTSTYYCEYYKLYGYFLLRNPLWKPTDHYYVDLFNILFSEVNFNDYSSSSSLMFRRFIQTYVFLKQSINFRNIKGHMLSPEESYSFAKENLNGEVRYFIMANMVNWAFHNTKNNQGQTLYNDFLKIFPNKPFTQNLLKTDRERPTLSTGDHAADFTLEDFDGKKIALNDFQGKWIALSFLDPGYIRISSRDRATLMPLDQLIEQIPANRFQQLIVLSNYEKTNVDTIKKDNNLKGAIFLKNDNWENPDLKPYMKAPITNTYIINPEGILEYANAGSPRRPAIEKFIKYINYSISHEKQPTKRNTKAILGVLAGFILLALLFLIIYKWRMQMIKKKEKRQREKLELEMQAVRSQLNPHFLFNSMNSIQHLVNADENEKANLFLSKFGALMRKVLNQSELTLIPLKEELETIDTYLELEALRHKFSYSVSCDETIDQFNVEIPPLLLQPFAENAVIHGIGGNPNGEIEVKVRKENEAIRIEIIDNGVGIEKARFAELKGKGLQITQKRVDLMMESFKNEILFKLINRAETEPGQTGTIAEIIFKLEA